MLHVCEARIDSCCSQKAFQCQASLLINSTRDGKELSRIKKELKQVYRHDGLVVRTTCCECVKPGSFPAVVKKHFNVRHRC